MFNRIHHQKIAKVLSCLNAELLNKNQCYFADGTAIALRYDEFRESVDIDFMTSNIDCYRNLRSMIREENSLQPLLLTDAQLEVAGDIRTDQYGVRCKIRVDESLIKFEIVLEGRIEFEQPTKQDVICGINSLTQIDAAASKILANSDRGLDSGTHTRDIIDLAMMELPTTLLQKAVAKAQAAYGKSAVDDLKKVLKRLEEKPHLLEENIKKLSIEIPQAVIWQKLRKLEKLS